MAKTKTKKIEKGIYVRGRSVYLVWKNEWINCGKAVPESRYKQSLERARQKRDGLVTQKKIEEKEYPKDTLGSFIRDKYWKYHLSKLKHNTVKLNKFVLISRVVPILGRKKIAAITSKDIFHLVEELQARGSSNNTVNETLKILSSVFNKAIKWELITKNPVKVVDKLKHVREEQRYLTADELSIFDDVPILDKAVIGFGVFAGARISEAFGFKWPDIDFVNNRLHFQRQYSTCRIQTLKTKASNAKIPLLPELADILQEWHENLRDPKKMRSTPYYTNDETENWVFPSYNPGCKGPRNPGIWRKDRWKPLVKSLGLEGLKYHSLRHSFASILANNPKIPIKVTQRMMRHANIQMTMDVYARVTDRDLDEIMAFLPTNIFTGSKMLEDRTSKDFSKIDSSIQRDPRSN